MLVAGVKDGGHNFYAWFAIFSLLIGKVDHKLEMFLRLAISLKDQGDLDKGLTNLSFGNGLGCFKQLVHVDLRDHKL